MVVLQACSGADATAPASSVIAVTPAAAAPRITRFGPDTLTAGGTVVIEGVHLPNTVGDLQLLVGGVPLLVRAVSANRIEATIPATGFPCAAVTSMPVRLRIGTVTQDTVALVATTTRLALAPGQTATLLEAGQSRCIELAAPKAGSHARYVVAVVNTNTDPSSTATLDLRGTGTGDMAGLMAAKPADATLSFSLPPETLPRDALGLRSHTDDAVGVPFHTTSITTSLSAKAAWSSAPKSLLRASESAVEVGDTVPMTALLNSCTTGKALKARVVYAGTKALILEDLATRRPKTLDPAYETLGKEYDQVVHPLLTSQIGNPLAMDETMGGDGRITMLFTPFVNDSAPGTAGYVSACNFYPRATFAGSNQNEVLYARVPSASETADDWRRAMRSTVVHEAKHLASFAERLSRNHAFEEAWLEEATARVAEELYSRTFPGGGEWKGRTGFAGSVACELLQCDDRPLIMWKHFAGLHGYLRAVDAMSPLAGAAAASSASYGSGWALVRWMTDRYASEESAWLKMLVRGGQGTGLRVLAQMTGRSDIELLADWSASMALDHSAADMSVEAAMSEGLQRMQGATPSWRVSDMMQGLAQLYPGAFEARPLNMRRQSFGTFRLPLSQLPGFASSYLTLEGTQAGSQLLELGAGVGEAASPLRAVIIRVR